MKIGIVIPFKKEAQSLINELDFKLDTQEIFQIYSSKFNSSEINLVLCGGGKIYSAGAAQYLIDQFKPDIIIHSGAGGRINSELNIFDVVWGKYIVEYDIFERIDYQKSKIKPITCENNYFFDIANHFISEPDHIIGTILSADRDVVTDKERLELYKKFLGDSCDWESIGIAKVAQKNNLPYIIFRVISDLADESAPDDFYKNLPYVSNKISSITKKILDFLLKN